MVGHQPEASAGDPAADRVRRGSPVRRPGGFQDCLAWDVPRQRPHDVVGHAPVKPARQPLPCHRWRPRLGLGCHHRLSRVRRLCRNCRGQPVRLRRKLIALRAHRCGSVDGMLLGLVSVNMGTMSLPDGLIAAARAPPKQLALTRCGRTRTSCCRTRRCRRRDESTGPGARLAARADAPVLPGGRARSRLVRVRAQARRGCRLAPGPCAPPRITSGGPPSSASWRSA